MTNYWAPSLFNFWAQAKTVSQTVLLSKLPSAWNSTVSSTFLTAESFISVLTDQKNKNYYIFFDILIWKTTDLYFKPVCI